MKTRRWIVGLGAMAVLAMAAPAEASTPTASCIGQQLSAYGATYGAGLGAAVSFEARNPEVLGTSNLGGWTKRRGSVTQRHLPGGLRKTAFSTLSA